MKNKYIYAFIGLFSLAVTGCNKAEDFGDTNDNPAATTQANTSALLTNVLAGVGNTSLNVTAGYYGQYFSETQYPDVSTYSLNQGSFVGTYNGPLYDLQNIIIENKSNNMNQVAKILQQYYFWRLTDQWGDVPYSQALKGIEFNAPAYDKQEDIYKGMIATLTTAAASFDGSAITGDIAYSGDVASWKRLANSMRILMAIQLSKKYPTGTEYAATQLKAALADGGGYITTNAQNFKIVYPGTYKNDIWNQYNGRLDLAESKTMTDILVGNNDPRANAYGGASEVAGTTTPSNVGVPYGVTRAQATTFTGANPNWARVLRGDLRLETSPMYIITAAEVTLARAEAANLGWTTEPLVTVYNQGIALSFEQWGVGTPSATYLANGNVAVTVGGANNVRNISTQRWVASYPDGLMAWNIYRKTGFPALVPGAGATNGTKGIPRRIAYSPTEQTTNKAANDEAIARLPGGNTQEAKVWWDQ